MGKDKKFDIEELFYNITMENSFVDNSNTGKHDKDDKHNKDYKDEKDYKYEKKEKGCKCEKNNKYEKFEKDDKFEKSNKHEKDYKEDEFDKCYKDKKEYKPDYSKDKDVYLDPCELCKTIKAEPTDIEKHGARLLTVKLKVNNVCFGKKVAIACIIYDKCHKILAFKGFTTMLCKEYECGRNECGTIERKIVFIIPDNDICDPRELEVKIIANYVYPCESNH